MRVFSSSDVLVNKKVVKLPLNWHKAEFLCTSILLVTPSNIFSGGGDLLSKAKYCYLAINWSVEMVSSIYLFTLSSHCETCISLENKTSDP